MNVSSLEIKKTTSSLKTLTLCGAATLAAPHSFL